MTFEEGMKQSIAELVEKKTALEKRIFELEKENETLKMGLQYDSDNRDDILNENSDLQQKYLEESFEKSKLVKEKSKIEDINLKLCEQNNELVEENGTLKTQVSILQGKNKGLKELVKGYENTRDRMIAMGFPTFKSVKEYAAKLAELEKENTELLEKLKNQKADYETYFNSCYNAQKKAEGNLTKAKEFIKQLLSYEQIPRNCLREQYRKLLEEAEQFLKEISE